MSCTFGSSYTVKTGDTLYIIAQQLMGDGNRWREILKPDSTSFTDADIANLQVGQEICIPNGFMPPPVGRFADIVPCQIYETMFPNHDPLYSYASLLVATQKYPSFCNEGSDEQCKREAAAFLANIAHETGDLKHTQEENTANWAHYCDSTNTIYPCVPGKTYHGRGPIQLSWNYNYGACGEALGVDLLNNPDIVLTDGSTAFMTALWFWMTPQPPKASCHDALRNSGFGMTIYIINGGLECGQGQVTPQAQHRIQLYEQFSRQLGVTPGNNLVC